MLLKLSPSLIENVIKLDFSTTVSLNAINWGGGSKSGVAVDISHRSNKIISKITHTAQRY